MGSELYPQAASEGLRAPTESTACAKDGISMLAFSGLRALSGPFRDGASGSLSADQRTASRPAPRLGTPSVIWQRVGSEHRVISSTKGRATLPAMEPNPVLAQWLLGHRIEIEARLRRRLGPAAPRASGPEAETLRRFRTFVSTALMRGEAPPPSLDGLRPDERRVMSLLSAWKEAASELAGPEGAELGETLKPLIVQFRLALRTSSGGRSQRARTSSPRRAVPGAIDRIADPFLAIDVGTATLVDANPAAGGLLGVERDSLFGLDLMGFVPEVHHADWWSQLDAVAESNERVAFGAHLKTVTGEKIRARASATAFNSRGRTVALIVLWPDSAGADVADATAPKPDSIASSTASTPATPSTSSPVHDPSPPPESNPQAVVPQANIPTHPSESS